MNDIANLLNLKGNLYFEQIVDYLIEDTDYYFLIEYQESLPFSEDIANMPWETQIKLMIQILEALLSIRRQGIKNYRLDYYWIFININELTCKESRKIIENHSFLSPSMNFKVYFSYKPSVTEEEPFDDRLDLAKLII